MGWRFTAYDLRSGDRLAGLPVVSWNSTDELVGAGTWSARIAVNGSGPREITVQQAPILLDEDTGDPLLNDDTGVELHGDPIPTPVVLSRQTTVMDATAKGRTVVVAERDGVPLYSGIVWNRRYDASTRELSIAGRGLLSYFDHHSSAALIPNSGLSYASQDQFAIVRGLVAQVQAAATRDIGVQVTSGNSGVVRSQRYERFDGMTFGEMIMDLSQLADGFDVDCRVEYNAGSIERWLRLWYPRRGRGFTETGLRFSAPGNAVLFNMDDNGSEMATTVVGIGAGDGPDMLVQPQSNTDLINSGWPDYSTARSYKDIRSRSLLAARAQGDLARLSGEDSQVFEIEVDPSWPSMPWGSWDLGDDARLTVVDDPAYPRQDDGTPGLVIDRRVVSHSWSLGSDSGERLVVGLGPRVIP